MLSSIDSFFNWTIFYNLVHTRSITRTSIELGVETSKVSRIIGQLEKELGRPLFDRKSRPLKLTSYGEEVAAKGASAMQEWKGFLNFLEPSDEKYKLIRLSTPIGIGRFYLNEQIVQYQAENPGITIEVMVEATLEDVLAKKVDVAFIPNYPSDDRVIARPCMNSFTVPLASKEYIKKNGFPTRPDQLINHTGLLKSGEGFPVATRLIKNDETRVMMWRKTFKYVDMLNIKDALLKGLGISLDVPLGMVLDDIRRGEIVQVLDNWHRPSWQYSVITRASDDDTTPIGRFAAWYAHKATLEIEERREEGFRLLNLDPTKI